jgi:hypothetical protein
MQKSLPEKPLNLTSGPQALGIPRMSKNQRDFAENWGDLRT